MEWLKDWPTLIAGLFAIIAAFVGGSFINKQIRHSSELDEKNRKSQFDAERAKLPFALSGLSDYAYQCASQLKEFYSNLERKRLMPGYEIEPFPSRPTESLESLTKVMETSDSSHNSSAIADLLNEIQVVSSRFRWLQDPQGRQISSVRNFNDFVLNVAKIYARISDTYPFARGEAQVINCPPSLESIKNALNVLQFRDEQFDEIRETAERRQRHRIFKEHPKSSEAKALVISWIKKNEDDVLAKLSISKDGEQFAYRTFRYGKLADAATYAILDKSRK